MAEVAVWTFSCLVWWWYDTIRYDTVYQGRCFIGERSFGIPSSAFSDYKMIFRTVDDIILVLYKSVRIVFFEIPLSYVHYIMLTKTKHEIQKNLQRAMAGFKNKTKRYTDHENQ